MRLVFSVGSLEVVDGGPSRSVSSLCSAVVATGRAAAEIVTCHTGGPRVRLPDGVTVHDAIYPNRMLRSFWGRPLERVLGRCVRERTVDVIHDNGLWLQTNHAAAQVARRASVPLVISPRGMLEPWSLQQGGIKKRAAWRIFQYADLRSAAVLHATSPAEAENLRRAGLRQPIAIIPNGIDLADACEPPPAARHRQVLFLSRLHPGKGLLDLVAAWARLRPAGWTVAVAGPDVDGHRAAAERAVQSAGLTDMFEFLGPVEGAAKRALLARADLFVLPTASENFGLAIGEALAAGVPVITTKGAPWSGLVERRCGWWIDHGVEPLVDALSRAIALTDDERRAMGRRGRAWIDERFAWNRVGAEMVAVYDWMLRGGTRPGWVHCA